MEQQKLQARKRQERRLDTFRYGLGKNGDNGGGGKGKARASCVRLVKAKAVRAETIAESVAGLVMSQPLARTMPLLSSLTCRV